jgi:GNAT superfamily N-acetyltransferase
MNALRFLVLHGAQARPYLSQIAELRIGVFRDFPYLYEGSLKYEEAYLETYFKSSHSALILCMDGQRVVGVSTAIALSEESPAIQKPFLERGLSLEPYVYFGESVLSQEYRGRGVGKEFFKHRLQFAREQQGAAWAVFCAVIRSESDPLRPTHYSPLNTFWDKQGFQEWTGMKCSLSWKRIGEASESAHELQFWRKKI